MKIILWSYFISALIIGMGLGTILVFADTASTSVTVSNATPAVSAVSLNGSAAITLTENTTTSVGITATITDANGCDDVFTSGSISSVFYRVGATASSSCTASDLNCYRSITLVEVGNTCTGGTDTTGDAAGTGTMWYFADATDASSSYSAQTWIGVVTATDASSTSASSTDSQELNTLVALNVTASITHGSMAVNASSSAAQNQTATTTNTGNSKIDIDFSGANMTFGGNTLAVTEQRYGTSTAAHADLSFQLTTTATARNMNIGSAISSSTAAVSSTFWGINIPAGTVPGDYTGTDTFTAIWSS